MKLIPSDFELNIYGVSCKGFLGQVIREDPNGYLHRYYKTRHRSFGSNKHVVKYKFSHRNKTALCVEPDTPGFEIPLPYSFDLKKAFTHRRTDSLMNDFLFLNRLGPAPVLFVEANQFTSRYGRNMRVESLWTPEKTLIPVIQAAMPTLNINKQDFINTVVDRW